MQWDKLERSFAACETALRRLRTGDSFNLTAEIPGTDPVLKDEIVMLGGHLDSWHGATGATDNAAGCAVMMEAVRILKTLGIQPRRTIRIGRRCPVIPTPALPT